MENEIEHVEVQQSIQRTAGSIEQIERASIDMQIATAHQYPKHGREQIEQVRKDIMNIATLDEKTASDCFYAIPRGGKIIDGPSIRLAEIAISCYGNIRDSVRTIEVVTRGPEPHVVVQAICHDLERNVAVSIEKRRRINKKKKNPFVDEDDINLAVNSAASFGLRDAAFRVIPRALISPIVDACKKVALGDLKSIVTKRTICIERLNKMGATTDRILAVLELDSIDAIVSQHLELLIGLGTALKDGQCTLEEAFPPLATEQTGTTADRIKKAHVKDPPPPAEEPPKRKRRTKAEIEADAEREAAIEGPEEEQAPPEEQEAIEEAVPAPTAQWQCERCKRELTQLKGDKCPYCMGGTKEL